MIRYCCLLIYLLKAFPGYSQQLNATPPRAGFTIDSIRTCNQFCINLTDTSVSPIYSYPVTSWSWYFPGSDTDSSHTQHPQNICYTSNGTYTITLKACGFFGCGTATYTFDLMLANTTAVQITGDTARCNYDNITLEATPGFTSYNWNLNQTVVPDNSNILHPSTGGVYSVTVTDNNGCTGSDSISVTLYNSPIAAFDYQQHFSCEGTMLQFINQSADADSFNWILGDGSTSSAFEPLHTYYGMQETTVTLIVSNMNCSDTVRKTISKNDFSIAGKIPNVFTPDENGLNDCFKLNNDSIYFNCYNYRIYNRWGQKVFERTADHPCWNGKLENTGGDVPEDVYYYVLQFANEELKGTVQLIR